jgi:CAP12/Pycsar effector protein, TIR domain
VKADGSDRSQPEYRARERFSGHTALLLMHSPLDPGMCLVYPCSYTFLRVRNSLGHWGPDGKPNIFIGSSSEGLPIAEAVSRFLSRDARPRLWKHQLFLPGRYPFEVLEAQLKVSDFAVLVASPDDELVKRGIPQSAMRDNLLLEFGLFSGSLGRRRTFFLCPNTPEISLPSDVLGIINARYDAQRVAAGGDEQTAAVQDACLDVKKVIRDEWASLLRSRQEELATLRASKECQAVRRLYTVASKFRDSLIAVQRDALSAISNRPAFEQLKAVAAQELINITESFAEDSRIAGVEEDLESLRVAASAALQELPFPQELAIGKQVARQRTVDLGMQGLGGFLSRLDPVRDIQHEVEAEINNMISALRDRYTEWWDKHSAVLQSASSRMQDALFSAMFTATSERTFAR